MGKKVRIIITGDYYPYPNLEKYCRENTRPENIFGDILPLIKESDISAINIEFPITNSVRTITKTGPTLKGDPITLEPIKNAGFNIACLSNNHTLDYGVEGLNDTVSYLNKINIDSIGYGKNLVDARSIKYIERNGVKLSFINLSENEFNVASETSPGATPLNIIDNVKDIRKAKQNSDFLILQTRNCIKLYVAFLPEPTIMYNYTLTYR